MNRTRGSIHGPTGDLAGLLRGGTSGIFVIAALSIVFLCAPQALRMRQVQRIFYFHVACPLVRFLGFAVTFVAGTLYLIKEQRRRDILGLSSVDEGGFSKPPRCA